MVLGDGDLARNAVNGRARGEDEGFDPGFEHGVEEVQARAEVLGVIAPRMDIGLAHLDEGGEVEDGVDPAGFEDGPDVFPVLEVADDELALPDELPLPRGEVVEDDDLEPLPPQLLDRMRPDVARPARDKHTCHCVPSTSRLAIFRPSGRVSKALSSWR